MRNNIWLELMQFLGKISNGIFHSIDNKTECSESGWRYLRKVQELIKVLNEQETKCDGQRYYL